MTTEQLLKECFNILDNKIPKSTFTTLASTVVDSLVKKFGKTTVAHYAGSEETSDINNIMTHIIEVGSLKCLRDANLIKADEVLVEKVFATVFIMNACLSKVLKSKSLQTNDSDGYYGKNAVETLVSRTFEHCKVHLGYNSLSEAEKRETFTVDELFNFYLGEYYTKLSVEPFDITCLATVSSVNEGSIIAEKSLLNVMRNWNNCKFEITNENIKISHNNKLLLESQIELVEQDAITDTFVGSINSFQKFRLVFANSSTSMLLRAMGKSKEFTIASMSPNGFAISFEH